LIAVSCKPDSVGSSRLAAVISRCSGSAELFQALTKASIKSPSEVEAATALIVFPLIVTEYVFVDTIEEKTTFVICATLAARPIQYFVAIAYP